MSEANVPYTFTNGVGNTIDATQVNANFTELESSVNDVDKDQLESALADKIGVSSTATVRRGKCIVATEESRTNTAYGTLTTPDQVASVVLPTDGLLFIAYQAMWKESVNAAASAALFIGSNQLKIATDNSDVPTVQATVIGGDVDAGTYKALSSYGGGLVSISTALSGDTAYTGDVTTGQSVGVYRTQDSVGYAQQAWGVCTAFAAAGTYTVSVQFKSSSGSVTVKNRKLWVWTQAF
jgi:hypothetical protein